MQYQTNAMGATEITFTLIGFVVGNPEFKTSQTSWVKIEDKSIHKLQSGRKMSTLQPLTYSEQMLYCAVRITTSPNGKSATGFFINVDYQNFETTILVTNKHVKDGANAISVDFQLAGTTSGELRPTGNCRRAEIPDYHKYWVEHPDSNYDLAALILEPFANASDQAFFHTAINEAALDESFCREHLSAIEEVFTFGFPLGITDDFDRLPIARRGITACHPALQVKASSKGIVDLAAMHGCSGSPIVLIHERGPRSTKSGANFITSTEHLILLGILYGGPVLGQDGKVVAKSVMELPSPGQPNYYPINLGYYIKACELPELIGAVQVRVQELRAEGEYFEKPFAIPMEPSWRKREKYASKQD